MTRGVLPFMRVARSGRIHQVTPVGCRSAIPGPSGYHASGLHAANRVIAAGPCDLEGSSNITAGACKDAQTIQRDRSTGAQGGRLKVVQFGTNRYEHGFLVTTIRPPFDAAQSIVLHLYPLLKVFIGPV